MTESLERIEAQARAWVLRLNAPHSVELSSECSSWRQADPLHDAAYRAASSVWSAIGRTPVARDGAWRDEAAALGRRTWIRRLAPAIALAAGLAALAITFIPAWVHGPGVTYATKVAETRRLYLADGSRVFVGARSAVRVRVDAQHRQVELKEGEAFFEVAKDPSRPFVVLAGDTTIRVVGTKFDVSRIGDDVKVAVLQGQVAVLRRRHLVSVVPRPTEAMLTPGEQISVDPDVSSAVITQVGEAIPGAWREGRLLYADAPLKDVIADANRYSPYPIRLASSALGELRVTATFRTDATDDLIANLEQGLSLRAERRSDGSIVLEDKRSPK